VAYTLYLCLAEGTDVHTTTDGGVAIQGEESRLVFQHLPTGLRAALQRLGGAGADEDTLAGLVSASDGSAGLMRWYYYLQRLDGRGLLRRAVRLGDCPLATLLPCSPRFQFPAWQVMPGVRYVLSRFAYLHRQDDLLLVASPRALAQVLLHDGRVTALVHALARPQEAAALADAVPGLPAEMIGQLLRLLHNAGVIEAVPQAGAALEDTEPALQCWQFHDLLFHARSRMGRHNAPLGGTYRFAGQLAPPPALKPAMSSETIDLVRPDLARLGDQDPPLAVVQQQRRSIRTYGPQPLSLSQLGEFLYRVGRVTDVHQAEVPVPGGTIPMDFAIRPYPGGGALYELELYVVVQACTGLAPGLYHYEPREHRLEVLAAPSAEVAALLADASQATGIPAEHLQVLLVLAARFPRMMWKYSSIAYAATLKHVGVLYQTMYLVATAMGLAPCGVGAGDSDRFARAAGLDYYAETSVGEFLLGSRESEDGARPTP
jgi:SagB-type dehydrogenase family enzyme